MRIQLPTWPRAMHLCVSALFLGAICAPLADELVRSDEERGPAPELRTAAPKPELALDAESLSAFPVRYENFYRDTFGLRDQLLRWNSIAKVMLFGVSPTPKVILGSDGSMIFVEQRQVDALRGLAPLAPEELEAWRRLLEGNRDRLRERGIAYLFVIAPNKETIYPERVPARFNRVGPGRFDQLIAYLEEHSDVEILDLRPALAGAKDDPDSDDELYTRDGTHWNASGSFVAYRRMIDALAESFPAVEPIDASKLRRVVMPGNADSWASRMYIGDLRPQVGTVWRIQPRPSARLLSETGPKGGPGRKRVSQVPNSQRPRAIFVHDSFGPCVDKLLAESFGHLTCYWATSCDAAELEAEKPDVVIQLFVERVLLRESLDSMAIPSGAADR